MINNILKITTLALCATFLTACDDSRDSVYDNDRPRMTIYDDNNNPRVTIYEDDNRGGRYSQARCKSLKSRSFELFRTSSSLFSKISNANSDHQKRRLERDRREIDAEKNRIDRTLRNRC